MIVLENPNSFLIQFFERNNLLILGAIHKIRSQTGERVLLSVMICDKGGGVQKGEISRDVFYEWPLRLNQ